MNYSFDINSQINNAINSRGNIVHEVINQNVALITAKISQSGSSDPIIDILDKNFASTVTYSCSYVTQGVYTLTTSEPIFGDTADKFYAENAMYFDAILTLSMITFEWDSPTNIFIKSYDSSRAAKEIDQNYVPFKLYVYPS
jgi:hypothetical protein